MVGERARLKVSLGLVRVDPVGLHGVSVDSGANIEFVSDDDERDVCVVGRRLERLLPLD